MIGIFRTLALAAVVATIAPAPYDTVVARRAWTAPDGRLLAVCILGRRGEARGRTLAVYDSTATGWRRRFLDDDRGFRPWAVELAEFDGDALPEVVVGAYHPTRFDPENRNRLFVFDLTAADALFAKWLGSSLGRPFTSFRVVPGAGGDRLCCRDADSVDSCRYYRWHGFGFTCVGVASEEGPR